MGDRVLRGSRLGAVSYESDRNIELAPRHSAEYRCANGHGFVMPFAAEAEVPATWECRVCGGPALLVNGALPEAKPGRAVRTHWDMLLERRTPDDLEELLAERLSALRSHRPKKSA